MKTKSIYIGSLGIRPAEKWAYFVLHRICRVKIRKGGQILFQHREHNSWFPKTSSNRSWWASSSLCNAHLYSPNLDSLSFVSNQWNCHCYSHQEVLSPRLEIPVTKRSCSFQFCNPRAIMSEVPPYFYERSQQCQQYYLVYRYADFYSKNQKLDKWLF